MAIRFYVDADTLGLAKVMVRLRWDVTYPGDPGGTVKRHSRPPCPITKTDVDDNEWIPVVAEEGWAIISRDTKIERRPAEVGTTAPSCSLSRAAKSLTRGANSRF